MSRRAPLAAVVFDLDGVLTDTAALHEAAWTRLFADVFVSHADGRVLEPFGPEDYLRLVDGRGWRRRSNVQGGRSLRDPG